MTTLLEKWDAVLNTPHEDKITDENRLNVTAQLLENQEKYLNEVSTPESITTGVDNHNSVMIKLVRRMAPKLIAHEFFGVQPMKTPTTDIFALRARYTSQAGTEALLDEADTAFGGAGAQVGNDPFDPLYATGTGIDTAIAEVAHTWGEMTATIEKVSVTAKTRQLKASYSEELRRDMMDVHGLDADEELSSIVIGELMSEVNREVIRTLYAAATLGAQFATTPGEFDLNLDSDGRWSKEKWTGLLFAISRDANKIAIDIRRPAGNRILCSPDVATALSMSGALVMDGDPTAAMNGAQFVGTLKGVYKVYVDPYVTTDFYLVGYKGEHQYDAGAFYAPHTAIMKVRATDPESLQPIIGFKTRYGLVANPFTSLNVGQNQYFRKAKVLNLL